MTDSNASNKPSVTELYRRIVPLRADKPLPDAALLDAQIDVSPAHAELPNFRRDLEPVSAQLSADLAVLFATGGNAVHARTRLPRGAAHTPRRWVAAAALAASLIAAVAFWGVYRTPPAPLTATHVLPDRIFAGFDEHAFASKPTANDMIFRGNFVPDEIFNASAKAHDG